MNVVHEDKDFYAFHGVPECVKTYLRMSVPALYRRFETEPKPRWLVHHSVVLSAIRLASEAGVEVKFSLSPELTALLNREKKQWNIKAPLVETTKKNPYATFFLTPDAPMFIVEAVWRAILLKHHPDHGGDPAAFIAFKEAYDELKEKHNNR